MAEQGRRTVIPVAVVALVIGVLIGYLFGRSAVDGGAEPLPQVQGEEDPSEVGPTAARNGVPVGYARTEDGAVQAAINYTRALLGEAAGRDIEGVVEAIAAPEWEKQALEEGVAEGANRGWSVPVAYRLVGSTDDSADVSLWTVGLVESEQGSLQEAWVTVALSLRWVDDDWQVASFDVEPGPAPTQLNDPNPEGSRQVNADYTRIEYEPASSR